MKSTIQFNRIYQHFLVLGGCFISALGSIQLAQAQNFFEYNNRHLPQSHTINPAFLPQYRFSLGLGYFSNSTDLTGGNLNSFFNSNETTIQTISRLIRDDDKQIGLDNSFQSNVFFAGFRTKKSYISFNSSVHVEGSLRFPKDLFGLMFLGNAAFIENDANIDFSGNKFMVYNQNQLSYGRFINNKLSIGANVGLINGIAHMDLNQARLGISTDTGTSSIYSIGVNGIMQGNASLFGIDFGKLSSDSSYRENIDQIIENNINNFNAGSNRGYNFGLGFMYRPVEKFRISGSIQNLGSIKWKSGAQDFNMTGFSWTFNGLDTNQIDQLGGNNDVLQGIADSLINKLSVNSRTIESYTTQLKPRYMLSAEYFITPRTQLQWIGGFGFGVNGDKLMNSISINQELGEWVDIRGNFTIVDNKATRVGLGMSLNLGPLQAFVNINDILGAVNVGSTQNISGMFGFNLNIGRWKDKDHDMVPDKRDSCRGVYGAISNNGCELGFLGTSMNYPEIDQTEEIKPVNEITEEEKKNPRPELVPTKIKGITVIPGTQDFVSTEPIDTALFDVRMNDLPLDTVYLDQVLNEELSKNDSLNKSKMSINKQLGQSQSTSAKNWNDSFAINDQMYKNNSNQMNHHRSANDSNYNTINGTKTNDPLIPNKSKRNKKYRGEIQPKTKKSVNQEMTDFMQN